MQRNKFPAFVCVIITTAVTASTVMAQNAPPAPETGKLASYGIAVVATLAIIGLSMMSAKRTHQD